MQTAKIKFAIMSPYDGELEISLYLERIDEVVMGERRKEIKQSMVSTSMTIDCSG